MRQNIHPELRRKFGRVKLVVTDVDGVLTDDRVTIIGRADGSTEEHYTFCTKDGIAVLECNRHQIPVLFISGRDSPAVRERARKLKAVFYPGVQDKVEAVESLLKHLDLGWGETLVVGNDVQDLSLLRLVRKHEGVSAAPSDAVQEVKQEVEYTAYTAGGYGAFREIIEQMFIAKCLWENIVNRERTLG